MAPGRGSTSSNPEPNETGRSPDESAWPPRCPVDWSKADDGALADGLRAADAAAFDEYYARYTPILVRVSRRLGAPASRRRDLVLDVLQDVALALVERRIPQRMPLEAYLIKALKRDLVEAKRESARHDRLERAHASDVAATGEPVIASTCSAHLLRSVQGTDADDESALHPVLQSIHAMVMSVMSEEDARIAGWDADGAKGKDMAAWLGVTHEALRGRLHRLRARMRGAVLAFSRTLEGEHRAQVEEYLRAWGVGHGRAGQSTGGRAAPGRAEEER